VPVPVELLPVERVVVPGPVPLPDEPVPDEPPYRCSDEVQPNTNAKHDANNANLTTAILLTSRRRWIKITAML